MLHAGGLYNDHGSNYGTSVHVQEVTINWTAASCLEVVRPYCVVITTTPTFV